MGVAGQARGPLHFADLPRGIWRDRDSHLGKGQLVRTVPAEHLTGIDVGSLAIGDDVDRDICVSGGDLRCRNKHALRRTSCTAAQDCCDRQSQQNCWSTDATRPDHRQHSQLDARAR
ncbi:hypothetical protein CDS [Bradyrhizobium sp.]|nr:hypothetical protein CDS [Bradyrhizobium sp.]CUU22191.1 hypothetical protein CDS [Bradyrhizobium sp.]